MTSNFRPNFGRHFWWILNGFWADVWSFFGSKWRPISKKRFCENECFVYTKHSCWGSRASEEEHLSDEKSIRKQRLFLRCHFNDFCSILDCILEAKSLYKSMPKFDEKMDSILEAKGGLTRYNNDTTMIPAWRNARGQGYAILHANWHGMATLLHTGLKNLTRPALLQGVRAVFNRFAHSARPIPWTRKEEMWALLEYMFAILWIGHGLCALWVDILLGAEQEDKADPRYTLFIISLPRLLSWTEILS